MSVEDHQLDATDINPSSAEDPGLNGGIEQVLVLHLRRLHLGEGVPVPLVVQDIGARVDPLVIEGRLEQRAGAAGQRLLRPADPLARFTGDQDSTGK